MSLITVLHLGATPDIHAHMTLAGRELAITRRGIAGDGRRLTSLVHAVAAVSDVIALEGIPLTLRLGNNHLAHPLAHALQAAAGQTPLVDGLALRDDLEGQAIQRHADLWRGKRVLLAPGLNRTGLTSALATHTSDLRFADPALLLNLPFALPPGARFDQFAHRALHRLAALPLDRLSPPEGEGTPRIQRDFQWADVIAGDMNLLRRHAAYRLYGKLVVTDWLADADLAELRARGVARVLVTLPRLPDSPRLSAATLAAILTVLRRTDPAVRLAPPDWSPEIITL